jgi:N-acetylglutamate synthase-like GNAT family acetyltransferase
LLLGIPADNESATIAGVVARIPCEIPGVKVVRVVAVVRQWRDRGIGSAFQTIARLALESGVEILVTIDGGDQFRPQKP